MRNAISRVAVGLAGKEDADHAIFRKRRRIVLLEDQIFADSHRADEAFALAVVGDVGEAELESVGGVEMG